MIGRVWKFSNNVNTDQIIPAEFLVTICNRGIGSAVTGYITDPGELE